MVGAIHCASGSVFNSKPGEINAVFTTLFEEQTVPR